MSMWHFEIFPASTGAPGEMETFMRDEALPFFRSRGFRVKFFATQHQMGQGEFCFVTEAPSFAHLDQWPAQAAGEPGGEEMLGRLISLVDGSPHASMLREVGEGPALDWDAHPMWHVECFDPRGAGQELYQHLVGRCLPYWRSRGFTIHVMQTELGLGPRALWLLTGMDRFGSMDEWEERAMGDLEGRRLMNELISLHRNKLANLILDVEAANG